MAAPGWIELFVARLEALGLRYMVTGSVASMIYGSRASRSTWTLSSCSIRSAPRSSFWREGGAEKHLRDVRAMLAAEPELDRMFLDAELRRRGLESAWGEAQRPR